jgi:pimeloyl-ACP methyl ester carboxylesterase
MSKMPTIVFVPGLWEGPMVYSQVESSLKALGYPTHLCSLLSTGTKSPGNPSMKDDIEAIRSDLLRLVEEGKDLVLVLHSAGGFLGSEAMEGLDAKSRNARGAKGGVKGIAFLTAGVAPKGHSHSLHPPPFFDLEV